MAASGQGMGRERTAARTTALFVAVLLVATCGLVYELAAGALASYVLGDSITQFSLVIGIYLSAMGLGAWLSRFLEEDLARRFVDLELAVALVGGLSAPVLFLSFGRVAHFRPVLFLVVALVGTLVGLEIPLFLRILRRRLEFKDLVAKVLSVDYLGALLASILFPLLFVPRLGLVRTSLAMGMVNALVGAWSSWLLEEEIAGVALLRARCAAVVLVLGLGLAGADRLTSLAEEALFVDPIIHARQSHYQRIVMTAGRGSFQLFLDGNLQFSSLDEYRYHEALVHPAFAASTAGGGRVLVLGGGDGLAVREILRHDEVREVTLVDIDPAMTRLASDVPVVRTLNRGALLDPRVRVVNEDAMAWLAELPGERRFDVVVVDFPDPNNFGLGKLYTTRFYRLLAAHLAPGGAVAVQSTSPLLARRSFWCIASTMEQAGFAVRPYHVPVPSFGEWGFMLARREPFEIPRRVLAGRFLSDEVVPGLFEFGPDVARVPAQANRLDNQILVQYYEAEWRRVE